MAKTKFKNGDEVKDKITGLVGIITATTTWLNGCVRYVIQPQEIKDGKPVESTSFDEGELVLVKKSKIEESVPDKETGGPTRNEHVSRRTQ